MQRESKKYLFDIQRAARLIGEFSANKTFADYMRDPMLRAAIEREFTIIGEAMSQLAGTRFPRPASPIPVESSPSATSLFTAIPS